LAAGDHPDVGRHHPPQPLGGRARPLGHGPDGGVEGLGRLLDDRRQHRLLGGDVGVQAGTAEVEGPGNVAHAGRGVAARAEQLAGHVLDLAPPGLHVGS
jgi:hypothetical protein